MSLDTYTGDGAQTDFTITYPYLSRDFIVVTLADAAQTLDTDYSYISGTTIRFAVAPPATADNVKILRVTSATPLVDFANGAALSEADLDTSSQQSIHIAEEANRYAGAVVGATGPAGPAGAGGGPELLSSGTFTNDRRLLMTIPDGYGEYLFKFRNFLPTDANAIMGFVFGISSGAGEWLDMENDAYHTTYTEQRANNSVRVDQSSNATHQIQLCYDMSNTKNGKQIDVRLYPSLGSNSYTAVEASGVYTTPSNTYSFARIQAGGMNKNWSTRMTHAAIHLNNNQNFVTVEWEVFGIA